jgi:hypothetical protein
MDKIKPPPGKEEVSHSFNCVDAYSDEPGDTTIHPCRPSLLEHAKAERAKIQAALTACEAAKAQAARTEKAD